MRQVFSSARFENVQAVARLLEDAGIEVRIENGQRYRGAIRGNFSYREGAGNPARASVWVVRSDDQPRARQMLREAGLLEATPANPSSFLPATGHAARAASPKQRSRLRFSLIIIAAVALALWLNQFRNPGWDLPEAAPAPAAPASVAIDPALQAIAADPATVHRIPVPPALAATLAARAQAQAPGAALCLSIDGEDPGDAALAAARAQGLDPHPASACPAGGEPLQVSIADYRTDGSGSGTVEFTLARGDAAPVAERLDVRRVEDEWELPATL